MKKFSSFHRRFLTALLAVLISCATAAAQTTGFTYQGSLNNSGLPANGNFDFEFKLFDSASGGTQLGATVSRNNITVTDGVFAVLLDFGAASFPGANRFLEISARVSGTTGITILAPRQPITSTPYTIRSLSAANADTATNSATANNALQLGGVNASQFVQTNDPRMSDARNPLPNSTNYIQNRTTPQTSANFNIGGDGTVGGTLTGGVVSASTQFNLGLNRVLAKVGANNLFLGTLAGRDNGGERNTMLGDSAGKSNIGEENTMIGFVAAQDSVSGSFNTFVGSRAGLNNITGFTNTTLGYRADLGSTNLVNATAIGANAFVGQSNALVLGSINGVNGATATTDVGIGVTQPARRLDVNGNIRVGSTTAVFGCVEDRDGTVIAGVCASDLRFKKDVKPFGNVLNSFSKLRPVNYFWRADEFPDQHFGQKRSYGLIAQEVEEVFPDLVTTDDKGFKAVNYTKLPLYTIQAVKEQQAQIEAQAKEIAAQKETNRKLRETVEALVRLACKSDPSDEVCKEER